MFSKKIGIHISKVICFISIGFLIFCGLEFLLIPKRFSYTDAFDIGKLTGFYDEEEESVDIIIGGTSHAAGGIIPMELYEKYGIKAYNLSTGLQPIEVTYFMLCEALKTQNPRVFIYDASSLYFYGTSDYYWRFVLDNMRMGKNKLTFAKEYCREFNEDDKSLKEALFPLLRHHTRWKTLCKEDFVYPFYNKHDYGKGGIITTTIVPSNVSVEYMNEVAAEMLQDTKRMINICENDFEFNDFTEDDLYNVSIPQDNIMWFKKIRDLCQENDIEFLVVKVPSIDYPQEYRSAWTDVKYIKTRELCDKYGIVYYDLLYDTDVNLDWEMDSFDGGQHLNLLGAQKVSENIGEYLKTYYELSSAYNELWNKDLFEYKKMRSLAHLQMEQELSEYISLLLNEYNDKTILIAASDDMSASLTEEEVACLKELGLKTDFSCAFQKSYIAVLENGEVIYEALSNRQLSYKAVCDKSRAKMELFSSGWLTGSDMSIKLNDVELAYNGRGMNIVVYDGERNLVLDSVCFDTYGEYHPALRDNVETNEFKKKFERYIVERMHPVAENAFIRGEGNNDE